MGIVYRARDTRLDRDVALDVLDPLAADQHLTEVGLDDRVVVALGGDLSAGKTAFVRGLALKARTGQLPSLAGFHFYRLKLLDLVAQSHRGQDVHGIVDQILAAIASDEKGVLVVDDLHLLVAKQGYPLMSDLIDTIKIHVSKGAMRALLTVDSDAFDAIR